METGHSALIVTIPEAEPVVAPHRELFDRAASWGVPAHVTVLFPFLPPGRLDATVRRKLVDIAAEHDPFHVRFTAVGRFPGLVYLAPEPSDPFVALTEACAERFPDFPPYGGVHDEIVPHLTVVETDQVPVDAVVRQLEAGLPFSHRIRAIEVITPSEAGPWHLRWRLLLGRRASSLRP